MPLPRPVQGYAEAFGAEVARWIVGSVETAAGPAPRVATTPSGLERLPHGVFELADRAAAVVARDRCMECGACRNDCAAGATEVRSGVGCALALVRASVVRASVDGQVR